MYEMMKKSKKVNRPVISRHETSVGRNALNGNGIIQRTTNIEYYPDYYRYNYNPEAGGFANYVTVGKKMRAEIDPKDEKTGSSASGDRQTHMHLLHYLSNKWGTRIIRGHLLNDHLGGLSIEENLFPISDSANKNHLNKIEKFVKGYTYGEPKSNGFVRPQRIVYKVEVFNSDSTQKFNEFNPQTEFRCDVKVNYEKNSGQEDFRVRYSVLSDISENTSNTDKQEPFGADAPQSRNKGWKAKKKCLLTRLSGDGPYYGLIRRKNRKGAHTDSGAGGEDVNKQKNIMGVVHMGAGPYVKSAEDVKFVTKIGWGKRIHYIYRAFREQIPNELINDFYNGMIEYGDSFVLRNMVNNNGILDCFQTIARNLNLIGKNQELPSELYAQLCSTLIYNLRQNELREEYDPITESIDTYSRFQNDIDRIIIKSGANIDQAKSSLRELLEIEQDDQKNDQLLNHILQLAEKEIQDKLLKEILGLLGINENNHSDAAKILITTCGRGLDVLNYSPKDFSSELWDAIKNNLKQNNDFPCLNFIVETYKSDWTNAPFLSASINSVIEMATVEIQDMIINRLTEVCNTSDFADISFREGYSLDNTILIQILEGEDSENIFRDLMDQKLDEYLLGAASLGGLTDDRLFRAAIRSFVQNKIDAQEELVDNMLFRILYEYLKTKLEPRFTDLLVSLSKSGKIDLTDCKEVYKVLLYYAKVFFAEEYDEDTENITLKEQMVENNDIMVQYVMTTMADFDWLSSPLLGQSQSKNSASQQNCFTAEFFKEALPYFSLSVDRFNILISRVAYRWTYEYWEMNPDESEYRLPKNDDQASSDGTI